MWSNAPFATTQLLDKRGQDFGWIAAPTDDFTFTIGETTIPSSLFEIAGAEIETIEDGLRVALSLTGPGISATKTVEVYNGIAGFASTTTIDSAAPLPLAGYTIEGANVGAQSAATIHGFRAGADWREPDWTGPQLSVGDPQAGTWRNSRSAAPGDAIAGPAQWISMQRDDRSLFIVMERNDQPSSVASFDGTTATLGADHTRDIVSAGPFEEEIHTENPTPAPGRHRVIGPGKFSFEPSFLGLGHNLDDEPWQYFKYLTDHRLTPYDFDVTFNSNGTDANRISTGAKDDLDYATILEIAPIARDLGVETFILDDGWQAISGDWQPDSPQYPEPRWDGSDTSKFKPRFPDDEYTAVREAIAPMKMGLWMSPMHFNHNSETFATHPEWACGPVGHGLAVYNALQPDSGSNEAGLGTWGPAIIPHIEERLRDAIENWGARYFKFDFLVWLDCAGQGDMYDYSDAFVAMVDRLQADHPEVTFQIDETNDYRMFPFESIARGPSWFQNGSPIPERLLHNIWNLSPYVPAFSLGQHALGGRAYEDYPVDTLMAVALTSHITFFSELRSIPTQVIEETAPWVEYYKRNREHFTQMIYPLLDDPMERDWTALQSWNPDDSFGALLVFRQKGQGDTQTVALRNVEPGKTFDLYAGTTEHHLGTFTSEELSAGIEISLGVDEAAVYLIEPYGN